MPLSNGSIVGDDDDRGGGDGVENFSKPSAALKRAKQTKALFHNAMKRPAEQRTRQPVGIVRIPPPPMAGWSRGLALSVCARAGAPACPRVCRGGRIETFGVLCGRGMQNSVRNI